MDTPKGPVKRSYDGSHRRSRADAAARRVVVEARRLLLSRGYVKTTVTDVASAAGVSPETVHKRFGGKPGLVKAVFDAGIAGEGSRSTEEIADEVSRHEADPVRRLRAFGGLVGEVTPRVAPLMLLVRAAAEHDAELAQVWDRMNAERLARMSGHARRLAADGQLRAGVGVEEARDVLWAYSSADLYDVLVRRRGWDPQRYGRWVGDAFVAALLPHPIPDEHRSAVPAPPCAD